MSCSSAPVTATSRSMPGNVALIALTAWATDRRVLEQAVLVGLVVVLGGRRGAIARPGRGALAEQRVEQCAQVAVLDRREQLAQVVLHRVGAARRAVEQIGEVEAARLGGRDRAQLELRAPARVDLVAARGRARPRRARRPRAASRRRPRSSPSTPPVRSPSVSRRNGSPSRFARARRRRARAGSGRPRGRL